jgi:hypothetical protein
VTSSRRQEMALYRWQKEFLENGGTDFQGMEQPATDGHQLQPDLYKRLLPRLFQHRTYSPRNARTDPSSWGSSDRSMSAFRRLLNLSGQDSRLPNRSATVER